MVESRINVHIKVTAKTSETE